MGDRTILAMGADVKNRFLIAKNKKLYFGPQLGDLSDARNFTRYKRQIQRLLKKAKARPDIIAYDPHPGYFSSKFAATLNNARLIAVQHHHAHIASVMCEHGLKKPVIGVCFDGTGYGTDSKIWGGEFLMVGPIRNKLIPDGINNFGFRRLAHFKYLKMPGGEVVVRQPWRMVLSILGKKGNSCLRAVAKEQKQAVISMLEKDINCPRTSSAGRLFDAAAALLGLTEFARYEAEGPIKLEALCSEDEKGSYGYKISRDVNCYIIDTGPIFLKMLEDLKKKKSKAAIAAKFHNSIADIIIEVSKKLAKDTGITDVALSGGVFQNKFLRTKAIQRLNSLKFKVYINEKFLVSDLNISLGQYYVSCRACKG